MRTICTCLAAILVMGVAHPRVPAAIAPGVTVAVVQAPGGATVQTGAGAAVAELGTVSANVRRTMNGVAILRRSGTYVVATAIGLRATSTTSSEAVSLQAFLETPIPGVHVRVDGIELTSNPITFATSVPLGVITRHRVEVEIPNGMNPGSIPQDIPLEFGATSQ
jgi:hypothetical protein